MVLVALKRGAASGLAAGALTAAFGYLLAEPVMDRAVELEAARAAALGDLGGHETFTRSEQHFGFGLAALVVGVALGVLFAVVYKLVHTDLVQDAWRRSLVLGASGFFALGLVPFLRYPANPPGTGDGATIETRTSLWLSTLLIGLVGAVLANLVARGLRDRGTPAPLRQLSVVGVLVATVGLTFVLPDNTDAINAPVTMIWDFRLLSIASLALLWGGLGVAFGLLGERARTSAEPELVPA